MKITLDIFPELVGNISTTLSPCFRPFIVSFSKILSAIKVIESPSVVPRSDNVLLFVLPLPSGVTMIKEPDTESLV